MSSAATRITFSYASSRRNYKTPQPPLKELKLYLT
jgi:hypothetical protein